MRKFTVKRVLLWGGFILVLGLLLSWNRIFSVKSVSTVVDPNTLPGIQITAAPWQPEVPHLLARLRDIGLAVLSNEGAAVHIHQHIDILVNGSTTTIPANIGINQAAGFISPIHTHDSSGIIHVESPSVRDFTLGEFFDVWGVRFIQNCVGGYCGDATSTLRVYVNGSSISGDPRSLVLAEHQEIFVVYGAASSTLQTLSTYNFASGF